MVGPLREDAGRGDRYLGRELEEQVVGGGALDKQVVGAGARGTARGVKGGGGGGLEVAKEGIR